MSAYMGRMEGRDTIRVGVLERVYGLILITYHGDGGIPCELIEQYLLRAIQILVLVDNHVIERWAIGRCRVIADEAKSLRNKLANKHRVVEP